MSKTNMLRARCLSLFGCTSANSARIPPSPWLSARITSDRYLTATTRTSDQNTSDRMPSTFGVVTAMPCAGPKHSLIAYSGEVPMSP